MWDKAKKAAADLKAKAADAVSEIDLSATTDAVKGKISSTVEAVSSKANDLKEDVGDRLTHPADAYDHGKADALEAMYAVVPSKYAQQVDALLLARKAKNPYA